MDPFSRQVRARIRLHNQLNEAKESNRLKQITEGTSHTPGQSGCFCRDCLVFRKQDWRVGDMNLTVVGPRDQWLMYCWGDGERGALCSRMTSNIIEPTLVPPIIEKVMIEDSSHRRWKIEREAKFIAVASGQYHTLLLTGINSQYVLIKVVTESHQLFGSGDNSYLNLCQRAQPTVDPCQNLSTEVVCLMEHFRGLGGSRVQAIACAEYASFALVDLPTNDDEDPAQNVNSLDFKPTIKRSKENETREPNEFNHVYSWGRGDKGVLGHGTTESEHIPRIIHVLNYYRVVQIAAGRQHVIALTKMNGIFTFGNGSDGRLGHGRAASRDTSDRHEPTHVDALEGVDITLVAAGNDFTAIMTDTAGSRQVFMWGRGGHGVLGNGDEHDKWKPTRVNALRGVKVRELSCGGAHTLVVVEQAKGKVVVMSWGCGGYGQLGHRDNWDVLKPKVVDEISHEKIRFVSAGNRHSLALSESGDTWVWGFGIHGFQPDQKNKDWTSSALFFPRKIQLPGMHVIGAHAGRGRTFVWGDRAESNPIEKKVVESDTLSESSTCSALGDIKMLSSNCLRVLYACGTCHFQTICVVCAAKCHVAHCLTLKWTLIDCLSKACDCAASGKCSMQPKVDDKVVN